PPGHDRDGRLINWYHYHVVRLWQEDPEPYLTSSVALLPLAPLTAVSEADLPGVVERIRQRLDRHPPARPALLLRATGLLMGLRHWYGRIFELLGGLQTKKESALYQRIVKEGRREGLEEGRQEGQVMEARRFLILLAPRRFGEPDPATLASLEAIPS